MKSLCQFPPGRCRHRQQPSKEVEIVQPIPTDYLLQSRYRNTGSPEHLLRRSRKPQVDRGPRRYCQSETVRQGSTPAEQAVAELACRTALIEARSPRYREFNRGGNIVGT